MFLIRSMKILKMGGGQKNSPVWEFLQSYKNSACTEYAVWYHCIIFHPEETYCLSEGMKGVVLYTRLNTFSVCNHVMSAHTCENKAFTRLYDGKIWHEREETLMVQGISKLRSKVEDRY